MILCHSAVWHWMIMSTWRAECFPFREKHLFLLSWKSYKHSIHSCHVRPVELESLRAWDMLESMRFWWNLVSLVSYVVLASAALKTNCLQTFFFFFNSFSQKLQIIRISQRSWFTVASPIGRLFSGSDIVVGITWNGLVDCILRSEAGMIMEGVQGAEAEALCFSVSDDIWYERSGVALYRIYIFVPASLCGGTGKFA